MTTSGCDYDESTLPKLPANWRSISCSRAILEFIPSPITGNASSEGSSLTTEATGFGLLNWTLISTFSGTGALCFDDFVSTLDGCLEGCFDGYLDGYFAGPLEDDLSYLTAGLDGAY